MREVVERGAFGGEQCAGVAFDGGKRLTCADGLPVAGFGLEARLTRKSLAVLSGAMTAADVMSPRLPKSSLRACSTMGRNRLSGRGKRVFSDDMGFPLLKKIDVAPMGQNFIL